MNKRSDAQVKTVVLILVVAVCACVIFSIGVFTGYVKGVQDAAVQFEKTFNGMFGNADVTLNFNETYVVELMCERMEGCNELPR